MFEKSLTASASVESVNKVTLRIPLNTDGTIDARSMAGFGAVIDGIDDAILYIELWKDYKGHVERGKKI